MIVSKLSKKITIEQVTETANAYGEQVPTWAAYASSRWAEVVQESGRESFKEQRFEDTEVVKFRLRFVSGVTPKMRVVYAGSNYNIERVFNVDNKGRYLELTCRKTQ